MDGFADTPYTLAVDAGLRYESTTHRVSVQRIGSFGDVLPKLLDPLAFGRPEPIGCTVATTPPDVANPKVDWPLTPAAPLFGDRFPALNAYLGID